MSRGDEVGADEERMLLAIMDAPKGDMGPRLVYADRLQEQDDPCGELIAVQVELANRREQGRDSGPEYRALMVQVELAAPPQPRTWWVG